MSEDEFLGEVFLLAGNILLGDMDRFIVGDGIAAEPAMDETYAPLLEEFRLVVARTAVEQFGVRVGGFGDTSSPVRLS